MGSMIHVLYQDNKDEHTCAAIVPMLSRTIEEIEIVEESMLQLVFEWREGDNAARPGIRINNADKGRENSDEYVHIMHPTQSHIGAQFFGVEFNDTQHITMSGGRKDAVTIVKVHTSKGFFAVAFHQTERGNNG